MSEDASGRSLKRIELIILIVVVGLFLCALFPVISSLREAARRTACINNMKSLGVAAQSFCDAHRCFPASNDVPLFPKAQADQAAWPLVPLRTPPPIDPATGKRAGTNFSWLSKLHPYCEPGGVYKWADMVNRCAWDPCTDNPIDAVTGQPNNYSLPCHPFYWRTSEPFFKCPSFAGGDFCQANPAAGVTTNPYEPDATYGPAGITNYVALGATDSDSLLRLGNDPAVGETQVPLLLAILLPRAGTASLPRAAKHPNGIMYPGSKTRYEDVRDGLTYTILACETREVTLAAWWEGSTAAVFGLAGKPSFDRTNRAHRVDGYYGAPVAGTKTTLNYGDQHARPIRYYLDSGPRGVPWLHGPSSEHPGVVNHLMSDGQVHSIQDDADPKIYMHLITRAGDEGTFDYFPD